MKNKLREAATLLKNAKNLVAFTGAGISAESNIPTFRGKGGIWDKYDPIILGLVEKLTGALGFKFLV